MNNAIISKAVLLCMPWQSVAFASVGLSIIKSELNSESIENEVWYPNFELYSDLGCDLYNKISLSKHVGDLIFCPFLYDLTPQRNPDWYRDAIKFCNEECGLSESQFIQLSSETVVHFLQDISSRISDEKFQLIGLGFTYTQTIANFSLIKYLKSINNQIIALGGGRAITDEFANLAKKHYRFDHFIIGESKGRIKELLKLYNTKNEIYNSNLTKNSIDKINFIRPDYSEYYSLKKKYNLPFDDWYSIEFSKGCWWGERSTCSFCGLNGESTKYIERNYNEIIEEILWAHDEYGISNFSLSDNILTKDELLLRRLISLRKEIPSLTFFAQVKSNLSSNEIKLMSNAGFRVVQPGIESLNTSILRKMKKGNTAAQQIETIRRLKSSGINSIYGILWGTVDETLDELRNQLKIMPFLHHLPPPSYFTKITFDRYSPYFENPSKYKLEDLKPSEAVYLIYKESNHQPHSFAWEFESDYLINRTDYEQYMELISLTKREILNWKENHLNSHFFYCSNSQGLITVYRQCKGVSRDYTLSKPESDLVRRIENGSKIDLCDRSLIDTHTGELLIDKLEKEGILIKLENKLIVLPTFKHHKKLILIVGESCVGKSTFCNHVISLSYPVFTVSDYIINEYGFDFYTLPPEEKLSKIGREESIFHGLVEGMKKFGDEKIVFVDSIKSKADPEVIRQYFPDFEITILRITANNKFRSKRFIQRNRVGDEATLISKDNNLKKIGIDELFKMDAYTIDNNSTIENFEHHINTFIDECLNQLDVIEKSSMIPGRELLKI